MDRSDRDKTARPIDEADSPKSTHYDLDESMLDAEGINPSTRVASLPPQSPRPRPAQLATRSIPDLQERGEEDIEMTAPPLPRPRPLTMRSIETSDANDANNAPAGSLLLTQAPTANPPDPTRTLPVLPPGQIDGQDFKRARDRLKHAVWLDSNGKYNQALHAYNDALALYNPALNSMSMSSGSRKALERTLSKHHERVVELEDARVYDQTDPDNFMVDHSRVPPRYRVNVDLRFAIPGPPASMVRPAPFGSGPADDAGNGLDQYLLNLQTIYDRESRSRSHSYASSPMSRESTPLFSVEPRDSVSSPQSAVSAPGRMEPDRVATPGPTFDPGSCRERAGTELPGGVDNFENRHPKRGLTAYGSIHGSEGRLPRRKKPKTMEHPDEIVGVVPASKALDKKMATRQHHEANCFDWMQDFYWNQHSVLYGEFAKDKYRDLRAIRQDLPTWSPYLIDQHVEQYNRFEKDWRRRCDSAAPQSIRIKVCGKCGAARRPEGGALNPCVMCGQTFYCSIQCQADHASVHRPACLPNWRTYDKERPLQRQRHGRSSQPLEDRLVVLRDLSDTIDRQRTAGASSGAGDLAVGNRTELQRALMSDTLDLDEYVKRAMKCREDEQKSARRTPCPRNDGVSSPSLDMASPLTPLTPKTPDDNGALEGVGGAFDSRAAAAEGLLAMRQCRIPGQSQAALRPATHRPNLMLEEARPPNSGEQHHPDPRHGMEGEDEDADHESDSDEDVEMDWEGASFNRFERLAQEEAYPKRITDFRVTLNGGRTLEYLVSDARRDQEWCTASTLLGPSW